MNIQKEILAKLLAHEDITVLHQNVSTASFDVNNRVLRLPRWENMENFTYDHLVGHEVGHALYTDADSWESAVSGRDSTFFQYMNVIEDARIEKMIQRRYPGLRSSFIKSYRKMLADGFFGVDSHAIDSMNLIDRINCHFKLGVSANVRIDDHEQHWVDSIDSARTIADVEKVALAMYDAAKKEFEEQENSLGNSEQMEDGESIESDESDESDDSGNSGAPDDSGDEDQMDMETSTDKSDGPGSSDQVESVTEGALRKSIESEFSSDHFTDVDNIIIGEFPLDDRIVSYKKILRDFSDLNEYSYYNNYASYKIVEDESEEIKAQIQYNNFISKNKKTINYLVKEFEMKKSAQKFAKARITKTGVLDPVKMNSYRYNDDIFRKGVDIPNGKNHMMIMYLDWSGSMSANIKSTMDQTLNLVYFCRQVGIPFRVYAFSDNHYGASNNPKDVVENVVISSNIGLMEIFSDRMSKKEFTRMTKVSLAMAYAAPGAGLLRVPVKYQLGGTPLDAAIVLACSVHKKLKKEYRVDVYNTIFLTDGESHPLSFISGSGYSNYVRTSTPQNKVFFVDKVTKKRYQSHVNSTNSTNILLKIYQDRTGSNAVGYRIMNGGVDSFRRTMMMISDPGDGISMNRMYLDNLWKSARKKKFIELPVGGYSKFFIVPEQSMQISSGDIELDSDMSKRKLTTAFKKSTKGKISSRGLLTRFIEEIA